MQIEMQPKPAPPPNFTFEEMIKLADDFDSLAQSINDSYRHVCELRMPRHHISARCAEANTYRLVSEAIKNVVECRKNEIEGKPFILK